MASLRSVGHSSQKLLAENNFQKSPTYIPCNTAELRYGTFPTCYDDFENCSEQPKTNKMGINWAPFRFLTFGISHWSLAPPIPGNVAEGDDRGCIPPLVSRFGERTFSHGMHQNA